MTFGSSSTPARSLLARGARFVEKAIVWIFTSLTLAAMFILIGQPGVDWVLVSPIFLLLNTVGPSSLVVQHLKSLRNH